MGDWLALFRLGGFRVFWVVELVYGLSVWGEGVWFGLVGEWFVFIWVVVGWWVRLVCFGVAYWVNVCRLV